MQCISEIDRTGGADFESANHKDFFIVLLKNPFTKRKCIKKKWHFDAGKSKRKIAIVIDWKGNRCKVSKYKVHYIILIFRILISDFVFE